MIERSHMERIALALENLLRLQICAGPGCLIVHDCPTCSRMYFAIGSMSAGCLECDKKETEKP